jgi:Holliday junction resolvasome RuvABC endonuclease subunit
MRNKTNVLAIDPGTREMGYAHFDGLELIDYGVRNLRTQHRHRQAVFGKVDPIVLRLLQEKRPDVVILEKNRFSQIRSNVRLALTVYRIRSLATRRRVPVVEYDPRTVRRVVCNNGNCRKMEVARTVAVRFPELKVYLSSDRKWKVRYYLNLFDAVACGLAYLLLHENRDADETA